MSSSIPNEEPNKKQADDEKARREKAFAAAERIKSRRQLIKGKISIEEIIAMAHEGHRY